MKEIGVLVLGSKGRMGREAVKAITQEQGLRLVGEVDRGDDLKLALNELAPDVVVDFTVPTAVFDNAKAVIANDCRPVIGASGLGFDQIKQLQKMAKEKQLGGLIAPNFAIGAVLMMKFAKSTAQYFPDVEIIELHHAAKVDAPSATAIRTAQMIAEARSGDLQKVSGRENLKCARGAESDGVRIHSIRLPGLVAHQEVIFGGSGQSLSIRHDSLDRASFMPGVCLACKKVVELKELLVGLEQLL